MIHGRYIKLINLRDNGRFRIEIGCGNNSRGSRDENTRFKIIRPLAVAVTYSEGVAWLLSEDRMLVDLWMNVIRLLCHRINAEKERLKSTEM